MWASEFLWSAWIGQSGVRGVRGDQWVLWALDGGTWKTTHGPTGGGLEEQRAGAGEEGEMTEEGTIGPLCFASWKDFVPRCDKICRKNTVPEPVMSGTPGQVFVQHHGSSTFVTWSGVTFGILRQIRVGVSVCPITSNSQYMIHYNLIFGRGLQPSRYHPQGLVFGG